MAYATKQDFIDRFGEDGLYLVFDRDQDGLLDRGQPELAIAAASTRIDGYLAGRYGVPVTGETALAILKPLCLDIANYEGSVGMTGIEEKRARFDDAIRYLEKVAAGNISLGIEKPAQGGTSGAAFSANGRLMTQDRLKGGF